MDPEIHFAPRPANRQVVTLWSVVLIAGLSAACILFGVCLGGCTSSQLAKDVPVALAVAKTAVADASSPAGQSILADVSSAALKTGLDLASGKDAAAEIAGIQGAASAVRDYEGLPTAPGSSTIAKAAAKGSGVASVAAGLLSGTANSSSLTTIIGNAKTAATTQKVALSADVITEAVARGLDAVANVKVTNLAGSPGEAP